MPFILNGNIWNIIDLFTITVDQCNTYFLNKMINFLKNYWNIYFLIYFFILTLHFFNSSVHIYVKKKNVLSNQMLQPTSKYQMVLHGYDVTEPYWLLETRR